MADEPALPVLRKFHVYCTGRTNGAHQSFVQKLKYVGQTEVKSFEECDYLLVFCPITSRVGTDIGEAMDQVNQRFGNKPVILVVMHHTFNPEHVVGNSSRQVANPDVILTVDTLFREDKFLNCNRNDTALDKIKAHLPVSKRRIPTGTTPSKKRLVIGVLCALVILIIIVIVVASVSLRRSHSHSANIPEEIGLKQDTSSSQCIHYNMQTRVLIISTVSTVLIARSLIAG